MRYSCGVRKNACVAALFCFAVCARLGNAQQTTDSLRHISHASSLTFTERDGTCIDGPILKVGPTTITVQQYDKPPITIERANLVQISQGDALLFTASNSWSNVEQAAAHVYPREAFLLKLKGGRMVTGKPRKVTPESISLQQKLVTTEYRKDKVETIDYLRLKPESDGFDYFSQEAPPLLFFDPEFYYRALGLEGRIPVRLYDDAKLPTEPISKCLRR
jgi:hypothetical protein